jgi:hypothetical protein
MFSVHTVHFITGENSFPCSELIKSVVRSCYKFLSIRSVLQMEICLPVHVRVQLSRWSDWLRVGRRSVPSSVKGLLPRASGPTLADYRRLPRRKDYDVKNNNTTFSYLTTLMFFFPPSIIRIITSRRMRWAGHLARMGEKRNAYMLLVGKPERNRALGRPRRKWVDIINMDLLEICWDGEDWIGLAQDRDKWRSCERSGSIKCWETTRIKWLHNWWPLE